MNKTSHLVSAAWLHEHLHDHDLIVLDASIPATATGAVADVQDSRILGARFFDLKGVFSDPASPYPNTITSPEQFQNGCRALGINNSSTLVVYDSMGIFSSPRAWWLLQSMGHQQVMVLDGGLPAWVSAGFPVEDAVDRDYEQGDFQVQFDSQSVRNYADVLESIHSKEQILIDARSAGRFSGTEAEPRKNLKSGHIPNSINIPYEEVLDGSKYKTSRELTELFASHSLGEQELIFSCGSGMTACIVLLAAQSLLENKLSVYDGSWTEWASKQNLTLPT